MRSRGVTLARCLHIICTRNLPHYIPLSPPVPSLSGGLILWITTQLRLGGHHYIIVAVDYFTKWAEAMPTVKSDGEIATHFVFNQIITQFEIPKELVTNHGSHFQNCMMEELASKLGYKQEHSSSYYPQANGQVEAVNKSLKSILQ